MGSLEGKKAIVAELVEKFNSSKTIVVVDYRGLTVAQATKLRKQLREAGVDAAVIELKKYEALVAMSNGKASKIIVPTDAVEMTKANVIFSETSAAFAPRSSTIFA